VRVEVPVFVTVRVIGTEVVPAARVGKVSEDVESETTREPPVPTSWIVPVFPLVNDVTVRLSVRVPTDWGVKATLIVQT
jgi:hypothetical protein